MVELKEPFATLWRGKDPLRKLKPCRVRYFVNWKLAVLCALKWRAKLFSQMASRHDPERDNQNLLSLRMPVLGADREWNAIHRLRDVGVDTMYGVAFGEKA